jgi:hypothetical protein
MSLNTRTVLVTLNISQWAAQKFDRKVTSQTNADHGASTDAGRFNKHLLHKDALKAIQRTTNDARTYHYNNTLSWNEATGTRILPLKKIPAYTAHMRKARRDFDRTVESFVAGYPRYVELARDRLGDMFDITDFPETNDVKARFTFEHRISPVPSSDDFRIDYPADELDEIKADLEVRLSLATKHAMRELHTRSSDVLNILYSTLCDPSRRVYRTTIYDNLVILTEQIRDMNFEDDEKLTRIAKRIETDLFTLDAAAIKADDTIRFAAAEKVDHIIRELHGA